MGRRQVSCPGQLGLVNLPMAEHWAYADETGQKDSFLPAKSYLFELLFAGGEESLPRFSRG